jgi:hypothetical protein
MSNTNSNDDGVPLHQPQQEDYTSPSTTTNIECRSINNEDDINHGSSADASFFRNEKCLSCGKSARKGKKGKKEITHALQSDCTLYPSFVYQYPPVHTVYLMVFRFPSPFSSFMHTRLYKQPVYQMLH